MKEIRIIISLFIIACLAILAQPVLLMLNDSATRSISSLSLILALIALTSTLLIFFKIVRFNKGKKIKTPSILLEPDNNSQPEKRSTVEYDCQPVVQKIIDAASGSKNLKEFTDRFFKKLGKEFEIMQAAMYLKEDKSDIYRMFSGYALISGSGIESFRPGEGLSGQAVIDKKPLILNNLPSDYRLLASGLGQGSPEYLYIIPLLDENDCLAVLEMASFSRIHASEREIVSIMSRELGKALKKYPNQQ